MSSILPPGFKMVSSSKGVTPDPMASLPEGFNVVTPAVDPGVARRVEQKKTRFRKPEKGTIRKGLESLAFGARGAVQEIGKVPSYPGLALGSLISALSGKPARLAS